MSENSQNLKPGARAVTGYFYAESYEYLNFATSAQLAHYKFFFKEGEIFTDEALSERTSIDELTAAIKKILNSHKEKISRYLGHLESFETIYKKPKEYPEFMKRHSELKYEISKFYNKISRLQDALITCANEQTALKKPLKRFIAETGAAKSVVAECGAELDDIYAHIQSVKNDKINRNIYILTLLSALFLPLNLITGFFGMNTNGMFLNGFQNGTAVVAGSMLALFATLAGLFYFLGKRRE
ncbi:CorA family divalent cation transporter [Campylobacter showae]|uniref:CorA family divalent cation transporter n=1 Tax=Campylobacter showae TaxID=204 RepID=UPI003C6EF923